MWEIQQLGRRAGALDIRYWPDVESTRKADEQVAIVSTWGCIREKMEDVRGPRRTGCPDLTDEARGTNSICASVLDLL